MPVAPAIFQRQKTDRACAKQGRRVFGHVGRDPIFVI